MSILVFLFLNQSEWIKYLVCLQLAFSFLVSGSNFSGVSYCSMVGHDRQESIAHFFLGGEGVLIALMR